MPQTPFAVMAGDDAHGERSRRTLI